MHPDIQAMDLNQIADLPIPGDWHRSGGARHRGNESGKDQTREADGLAGRGIGRSAAVPLVAALLAGLAVAGSAAPEQPSEKMAAFSMPVNVDQWRSDILGQNGFAMDVKEQAWADRGLRVMSDRPGMPRSAAARRWRQLGH